MARILFTSGGFGESFNAGSANSYSLAVDLCPLQIDVFAITVDGIIIAAQEFALVCHH